MSIPGKNRLLTPSTWRRTSVLIATLCTLGLSLPSHANPTLTSFDPPGSVNTIVSAINADGTIVGSYDDANNARHGFVRTANGTITPFDPLGSTSTEATGINAEGRIAGSYVDSAGRHGFLRKPGGAITSFDVPGGSIDGPTVINGAGVIAGQYHVTTCCNYLYPLSFVRAADGTITTFQVWPGATILAAGGLNHSGTLAGTYSLNSSDGPDIHAFIRTANGTLTVFDYPQSGTGTATDIDAGERITGGYWNLSGWHGYVRSASATFTPFDVPGSLETFPQSIAGGKIAGYFLTTSQKYHSFVRATNGGMTTFHVPGTFGTYAMSISNGRVAGNYVYWDYGPKHGFVRTP